MDNVQMTVSAPPPIKSDLASGKIAAYIAGDENIIYPGIITLTSVKEHNGSNLDLFLFTEVSKLTQHQFDLIQKFSINVVDVSELDKRANIGKFSGFRRWPVHVFYNYVVPIYLCEQKYDYAIKLDYDMLCLSEYNFSEILPTYSEVISIVYKRKLSAFIDELTFEEKAGFDLKLGDYHSVTAGFFVVNTQAFVDKKFFDVYTSIYSSLQKSNFSSYVSQETVEQFTFGLVQSQLETSFKKIHPGYNYRPYYFQPFDTNYNIHFNTNKKPWHDIPSTVFSGKSSIGWLRAFLFFNYWIDFANGHGLKEIIKKDRYTVFDFWAAMNTCINSLNKNKDKNKSTNASKGRNLFKLFNIFK